MKPEIRPYQASDNEAVIGLWTICALISPFNDPQKDIARKLKVAPDLFLVAELEGKLVGTAMVGYEGHRGWINYLAVAPGRQRTGIGRLLMEHAEGKLRALGCPKINLQMRKDNFEAEKFYTSIGYKEDAVRSFGKRLVRDGPNV